MRPVAGRPRHVLRCVGLGELSHLQTGAPAPESQGSHRSLTGSMLGRLRLCRRAHVARLVPQSKVDDAHICDLETIDVADAQPILRSLLEWIRDMNWPVARKMVEVLPRFHEGLAPIVKDVLRPDEADDTWKYWIIDTLLDAWPEESLAQVLPSVERIAARPTPGEHREEVDRVSVELLQRLASR